MARNKYVQILFKLRYWNVIASAASPLESSPDPGHSRPGMDPAGTLRLLPLMNLLSRVLQWCYYLQVLAMRHLETLHMAMDDVLGCVW